jgi:hypothetical protein
MQEKAAVQLDFMEPAAAIDYFMIPTRKLMRHGAERKII